MKIALSTDHAGLEPLKTLQKYLQLKGFECIYFGPQEFNPDDDYPDLIKPAAQAVSNGECQLGIIIGGSGEGEAMVANRFKGVRCAVYYGPATAVIAIDAEGHDASDQFEILRLSRQHNDANMLSLARRFLTQNDIEQAVDIWLSANFSQLDRHRRRIEKIDG